MFEAGLVSRHSERRGLEAPDCAIALSPPSIQLTVFSDGLDATIINMCFQQVSCDLRGFPPAESAKQVKYVTYAALANRS